MTQYSKESCRPWLKFDAKLKETKKYIVIILNFIMLIKIWRDLINPLLYNIGKPSNPDYKIESKQV